MKFEKWQIPTVSAEAVHRLTESGYPYLVSAVLVSRGITTAADAAAFLAQEHSLIYDPRLMRDMDRAVGRISRALADGERMAVFGDYDVDGITATVILVDYLKNRGADCLHYIPRRIEDGYGLSCDAIAALRKKGVSLLITVDCGITGVEEVAFARSLGMDVVITDHHECKETLPDAVAVVDPHRPDCSYPFKHLAGCGVALKLVLALAGPDREEALVSRYCTLAAVGTVADVMQMSGENRTLVSRGLASIDHSDFIGLHALLQEAGLSEKAVTSVQIGFVLAPRINAAGRMGEADKAAELLLSSDPAEAARLARELCALNRERQSVEQEIYAQALEMIEHLPEEERYALVLSSDAWHQGVVGIVASRLSEKYACPSFMIHLSDGVGKGSCRSFGGFNLYNALSACSEYLEGFGGHALAAGLTIRRENIDRFRRALGEYYRQNPADDLPELTCDLRVNDPHLLTMPCIESLDALEPCGNGNPKPLLCITGARLVNAVPIGGGRHLRLHFAKGGYNYAGIFFSCTPAELGVRIGQWVDVAFTPQINEFRGRRSVQLLVTDVRPSDPLPLCRALLKNQCIPAWDTVDLYPLRADFAVAWRWLSAPVAFPLGELPARAPMRPEKFCVCLRVMAEMGLAAVDFDDETLRLRPLPTSGKVDLGASKLLQTLRERRQSLL